jgi:hypothetical protein
MSRVGRAAAPLGGVALSVALFLHAGQLDAISVPGQLGPSFWPRVVLAGLALACAGQLLVAGGRRPAVQGAESLAPPAVAVWRLAAAGGLLLLYVGLIPVLGFPLATAGFVVGFMRLGGARSWPATAAVAAIGTVSTLYLFVKLVYLPLPKGDGPFEALTLVLYRALRIF